MAQSIELLWTGVCTTKSVVAKACEILCAHLLKCVLKLLVDLFSAVVLVGSTMHILTLSIPNGG